MVSSKAHGVAAPLDVEILADGLGSRLEPCSLRDRAIIFAEFELASGVRGQAAYVLLVLLLSGSPWRQQSPWPRERA